MNLNKDKLKMFGKAPICNGKRERGIIIRGFCFPFCTRCTFVTIGAIISSIFLEAFKLLLQSWSLFDICATVIIFEIPMFVDGIAQYKFYIESNNMRRAITGFLSGTGIVIFSILIERIIRILYCNFFINTL